MKHPTGKGVLIWQLKNSVGGNMEALARRLKLAKFAWVAVKMANGLADFNAELLARLVEQMRLNGIAVWGWQYVYGANVYLGTPCIAKGEAEAALRNIERYQPDGWIIDPEREYKRKGASAWADIYMNTLHSARPELPIGLCSYRYPSVHPELPWRSFLRYCTFHAPQVYWVEAHNSGAQLRQSVKELRAQADLPFVPIGSAYYEGTWKGPTVAELDEFDWVAHELSLPGVGWWSWDSQGIESRPEWLAAIMQHQWREPDPQPPKKDFLHSIYDWAKEKGYSGPGPDEV